MSKAARMRLASTTTRVAMAVAVASLVSACVQPVYQAPGPIQLQPYPPAVSYYSPEYRPPVSGPIPLQTLPDVQPLPPPTSVTTDSPATDGTGAIPVQDMPAPASTDATPAADPAAPAPTQVAAPVVRKTPATGPGANVPLEGFRPMHGQSRAAP